MTVLVFADHNTNCPVCRGDERIRVLHVRRRGAGFDTADRMGAVVTCPLVSALARLFPGGGPRATA